MLGDLSREDRLLLLKFLCAFAWTDLEVTERERGFVHRVLSYANLGAEDAAEVETWLDLAPSPSEVDPKRIPVEHRQVFIEAIRALVYVDGRVDDEERANFDRLRAALNAP